MPENGSYEMSGVTFEKILAEMEVNVFFYFIINIIIHIFFKIHVLSLMEH